MSAIAVYLPFKYDLHIDWIPRCKGGEYFRMGNSPPFMWVSKGGIFPYWVNSVPVLSQCRLVRHVWNDSIWGHSTIPPKKYSRH